MALSWEGEPLKISNSEMMTYLDDRRIWYLTYYRRLRLKRAHGEISGPRSLGSRVHAALEKAYTEDRNPLMMLKEIYEEARGQFEAVDILPQQLSALDKEYDLAHAMVGGFVDWMEENGIDDGITVVGTEEVVQVPSHIPGVFWRGKMDQRIVRDADGARLFRDFKTVGDLTTPVKILQHDSQMKFYHLLEYLDAMNKTGGEPQWRTDGALYLMLRKVRRTGNSKPPYFGQLEVHHNIHEIRNHYKRAAKITEEIVELRHALDAGGDFLYLCPERPNRDWTWKNDFLPVMSLMCDGSDYEGMLSEYYEECDPDERYKDDLENELAG